MKNKKEGVIFKNKEPSLFRDIESDYYLAMIPNSDIQWKLPPVPAIVSTLI